MIDEIKGAIINKNFIISIIIMLICFLGIYIPSWLESAEWGDIYRPTALEQTLSGIFFGGVMLIMPFCASFPYASSQVDELRTKFFYWKVMRIGVKKYARNKITATMLSGGASVTFAFVINLIIWHIIAMPYDPVTYENQKIFFSDTVIWGKWDEILYALPIYIWIGCGIFITSAVWAFFGLTTAVWISDKVLCSAIPVGIYHLWLGGFTQYVFGIKLASPEALFNDGLSITAFFQSITTYSIIVIMLYILYMIGLERKSHNE